MRARPHHCTFERWAARRTRRPRVKRIALDGMLTASPTLRWSFAPTTLTVTCVGASSESRRDPARALSAVADFLESRYGTTIAREPESHVIRFRGSLRTGRSWLGAVTQASVRARREGDVLLVQVSASVWSLLWIPVTGLLAAAFVQNPLVLWVIPPLVLANYATAHLGIRRLVLTALEPY